MTKRSARDAGAGKLATLLSKGKEKQKQGLLGIL